MNSPSGAPTPTNGVSAGWIAHIVEFAARERLFLVILTTAFVVAGATYQTPHIAMWIGFMFAAYSAIANDSIQTIGTFLASNAQARWWVLWIFIAGIFLATTYYSWHMYNGDVSYGRLQSRGFDEAPTEFSFLQIAAPLVLLTLTRMRMPVSTTFLLLSCFATQPEGIADMLGKSVTGYFVAFGVSITIWFVFSRIFDRILQGEPGRFWRPLQWIASGALWSVWLQQDAANIAVFLPRSLSVGEYALFAGTIVLGLGILLYLRGDRIQQVVTEKKNVVDVRAATILDIVYASVLYYFKALNPVPMSTTWVFIGLLAGRELAMALTDKGEDRRSVGFTLRLIAKDVFYVTIGLVVSLLLAAAVNERTRDSLLGLVGLGG
ncbi:MAG: hypothetical protein EA398_01085 [Deltaproteobacteria bacterium]|nr:MAG: hypothetical protein EA398_01085 [Deltaproteobacteria bacterium]